MIVHIMLIIIIIIVILIILIVLLIIYVTINEPRGSPTLPSGMRGGRTSMLMASAG